MLMKNAQPSATLSSMPPPLREAVEEIKESTRILALVSMVWGIDPWLRDLVIELEIARDRIVAGWRSGDTSATEAARALRHADQRYMLRLTTSSATEAARAIRHIVQRYVLRLTTFVKSGPS